MSKYLLEVGVEELPYKFIPMAISQLENGFKTFLENNNVKFDNIKVMATPRRLAVIVDGLAASQPDVEKVIKGPIATVAYDENKNYISTATTITFVTPSNAKYIIISCVNTCSSISVFLPKYISNSILLLYPLLQPRCKIPAS